MISKEKKNVMLTTTVYKGGGGSGRSGLEFENLFNEQCSMYARTVNKNSDFQIQHLAQEKRQISVVDLPVTIYINVAREDFPSISARICIIYVPSAAQQGWAHLLKDICKALKIDFIDSILDRVDKSPVHRIMRLRPEGDYLVRQRETSSILEVINTGITPVEVSWEITMDINDVKQALALDGRNMPVIDRRIADLVAKPVVRETQRDISTLIINAVSPKVAVGVMTQFHKQFKPAGADSQDAEHESKVGDSEAVNFGDIKKYGDAIDIVCLHRLCLETLGRFAANGRAKNIAASPCFEYVCDVIEGLRQEVDVVALGLKLLSDVSKYLVDEREKVFHVVLNCVQAYAPPEQKHRPRNPKRLRSPEELFEESGALNADGVGSPSSAFAGGGGDMLGRGSSAVRYIDSPARPHRGGAAGRAAATENPPNPNQSRYGDFYGHSTPALKGSVVEWSQAVTLLDMSSSGGADIVSRLQRRDRAPSKETDNEASGTLSKSATEASDAGPSTPAEVEIKALVRGRVRLDHQAASQALQTAFHTSAPSASATASSASGPNSSLNSQQRDAPTVPVDAAEAEFLREQKEFQEKQSRRQPKYQFKFKRKGDGQPTDAADEAERKLQWKGTVGVIGRKAPEKPKEVVIDFKKKIMYDPNREVSGQDEGAEVPAETPKTEEELAAAATEEADNAAVAEALRAASAATSKRKKKRHHKLTIAPLPLVPCVQFRGLSGRSKQTLAMMQSFATMFKLISQNYGNRDVAFKMGLAEEVSVVVTVCQGMPRVLDYYIWVIDALYRDGFGELSAEELDIAMEDYTMVLSDNPEADTTGKQEQDRSAGARAGNEDGSMVGFQFETISEMSIPSFDQDGLFSEATPVVNIGAPLSAEEAAAAEAETAKARRRETRRLGAQLSGAAAEESSKIGTGDAVNENAPEISNQLKKAANQALINALGLYEFEARYVKRPGDEVVLGVALVSIHPDLESREKLLARRWLDVWDDGSRSYKTLKKKGMDLAGL